MSDRRKPAPEGAPRLETPGAPLRPPEGVPRDEAPLETPEEKSLVLVELRDGSVARVPATVLVVDDRSNPEVDELYRHVATHPVDAHAPAWLGREPNSP